MSSLLSTVLSNLSPPGNSFTKFLTHNNTPVSQYCNLVPISQPSLVSTSFGHSLVSLSVLLIYYTLYRSSSQRTGVESRLLTSLIIGNLLFTALTFNDWFNLRYDVIFCNDYKNGVTNLYQTSELIEAYKLKNLVSVHLNLVLKYSALVYKQFIKFFIESYKEAIEIVKEYKHKN